MISDFQIRRSLKPLMGLEKIQKKKVSNPLNFRSAPIVTTFVRSVGDRTQSVWNFLEAACHTDAGVRLAELEHPSLKKNVDALCGRTPIYVHPSCYRALKVRFPLDVQRQPSNYQALHWLPETDRQHPHRLFPDYRRH